MPGTLRGAYEYVWALLGQGGYVSRERADVGQPSPMLGRSECCRVAGATIIAPGVVSVLAVLIAYPTNDGTGWCGALRVRAP